jgi:Flp pilus assembly pilin Flp
MASLLCNLWSGEVMLAVILILVIGTVRLVGGNANNAFSAVASTMQ